MDALLNPDALVALVTLTVLEVVLGVDNVIFISILAGKLPADQQDRARRVGLLAAMLMRIALLFSLAWIVRLTAPLFTVLGEEISGRDLILLGGGLFLLWKATSEIHDLTQGEAAHEHRVAATFAGVLVQIMLIDLVFSLDSIITAVGMVDERWIMATAILLSIGFMLLFAKPIGDFVERHPTVKVLALSFLIMIGLVLIADGFGRHIPKGYIYAAMAFSVFVEMINLWIRKRSERKVAPVKLHEKYAEERSGSE